MCDLGILIGRVVEVLARTAILCNRLSVAHSIESTPSDATMMSLDTATSELHALMDSPITSHFATTPKAKLPLDRADERNRRILVLSTGIMYVVVQAEELIVDVHYTEFGDTWI